MGKIIFVNPPITPYERYGSLETVGDFVMPNGLCNLAAMTRCAGHETEIIDCEALGLNYEEAAQVITRSSPDYVEITAATLVI